MRAFFAILLLCNLALLAYQIWVAADGQAPSPPRELNADKIVILDAAKLPAPQLPRAGDGKTAPAAAAVVAGAQCFEWGTFEASVVAGAELLLKQRLPEIKHTRHSPEGVARYWVYIPPAGSAEETQARLDRLKRKGAGDVVVIREDAQLRNAVSLGIFSSAAAAQRRLAELDRLNIRGARVAERRASGSALQLVLRNVDPALRPNLEKLVEEIGNTELREVTCPAETSLGESES